MIIRVTTDPMTQQEVINPEAHPCVYDGDGENGLEIYFESEQSKQEYLNWDRDDDHKIVLKGSSSADYVAEG
ncbi:MAG: hypothetical protein OQL06_13295 [Gammaproteobacteria bacterium]|nr:hypothetical protein [Gammaproteobacteria bacterium]